MKNQEYVHSEYPRCCRYCEKGTLSFDESAVLCEKKGIIDPDDCCRQFVYDPLKRVPMEVGSSFGEFTPEDFSL